MNPYHPIQYKSTDPLITSRLPDLSISFPSVPAQELLEALRSAGSQELVVKGQKTFLIPSPNPDLIRAVATGGAIRTTPSSINSVNIDALATLSLIRRIFSSFFFTHVYPAFQDPDHLEYMEAHWPQGQDDKGKRVHTGSTPGPSSKRARMRDDDLMSHTDDEAAETGEDIVHLGDRIILALPQTRVERAWGNDTVIPQGHGIFVRYIDETQNSNGERIIHDVITRYFLGVLGQSAEAVRTTYERIKRDLGVIITTSTGRELAHMAKCLDLGLQAQARIFPVVSEDQYLGCCLLGVGFQISSYGTVHAPVDPTTLLSEIERAGSHRSALHAIADIACAGPDEPEYRAIVRCPSMVHLRHGLLAMPLSSEDRDRIGAVARGLRFKSKSLNVSAANVAECFRLIQHSSVDLPTDFPVHPTALFENNRVHVVWSAFGDLAPTCVFPGGPQVDLTSAKDLPKHVGFRMIPLKDAILDIEKIMSSKIFPNCTLSRRSGPFKDRIYTGIEAQQILSTMVAAAGVEREKGKKRSGGAGNVDVAIMDDGF
jgi:hypothetical protein